MKINDAAAIERMRLRVKADADKIRALEKEITDDFIAGMLLDQLAEKYHYSKSAILAKINANRLYVHGESGGL